ncbi:MAG: protein gvpG [Candidatus Altiarchaeales archaeon HGW-Altiarchaeales-3]|nr:MAG: protein gvpG [Candidatus Altiarchaeales archaeon HGW-Altiarchaeales-3]
MAFIIDDLILGPPMFILRKIRDTAYQEMYNLDEINKKIKENRMLYELEEIPKEDYEEENIHLMELRKVALEVRGMTIE